MGTLQRRFSAKEILAKVDSLIGKRVNIVNNDNTVVSGWIKKITPNSIILLNDREKSMTISVSQVDEFFIDA